MSNNHEELDFEEFFTSRGFEVTEHKPAKRGFFRGLGAFAGIVAACVAAGALITVPATVYASAAVQVAEPAVQFWKSLPDELKESVIGERNKIFDKNGSVIAEFWTEDRLPLESLDQINPLAIEALVDTEDARFYEHNGFDVFGTARAALTHGGGSGITQQLVKNLQFYDLAGKAKKDSAVEQSLDRKIRELRLAMGYEKTHSKDEILLKYFNTVAFGSPSIYSVESAANYFFNKPAKDLTLAESAALVGSVNNPAVYNLDSTDPDTIKAWKSRQKIVIDRMVTMKSITQKQADEALATDLKIVRKKTSIGNCSSSAYPFYCDYVVDSLMKSDKFGETREERAAILAKGGLQIHTYLDPAVLRVMQDQLISSLGNDNRVIAPTAIVEPGTGGVIAFAANRAYGNGPGRTEINLADVPAATGSTYKMIALAAARESGMSEGDLAFGSNCPLYPGPDYDAPEGGFGNSMGCGMQNGFLTYKQATAWSSNTWFLTLAMKVGMPKIIEMGEKLGLRHPEGVTNRSLSTVLGSPENSPIDMAAAFATFANEGVYCPANPVKSYSYADGTAPVIPETYNPALDSCRSVMSPATASTVLKAMRANTVPGEVNGAFGTDAYIPGYDAVGKSGTNEHMNYVWAQVSKNYSLFINFYDMDNTIRGVVDSFWWRGYIAPYNTAALQGSDILRGVVGTVNPPRKGLNYNSTEQKLIKVPVDNREFFTIPSLVGMEPEEALSVARSLGMKAEVSKTKSETPKGFPSGVITEQSIAPGTQLPTGTKKEFILYIGK